MDVRGTVRWAVDSATHEVFGLTVDSVFFVCVPRLFPREQLPAEYRTAALRVNPHRSDGKLRWFLAEVLHDSHDSD